MSKRKYKLKKRIILLFIFIVLLILFIIFYNPIYYTAKLLFNGYSFNESINIYRKDLYKECSSNEYNDFIANYVSDKSFVKDNYYNYINLDIYYYDNYLDNVNKYITLGYTSNDINIINSKDENIRNVLLNKYVKDISSYLAFSYFKIENLDRYLDYYKSDYKNTIVSVNIGLDKEYYKDSVLVNDYNINMIVNKYNKLANDYVPSDLVVVDNCSSDLQYLSREAKEYYDKMCEASKKDNINLSITSSYRSFNDQQNTYNFYLNNYGLSYVKKYVATPGYSEHQTGLCFDAKSLNSSIFKESKEYTWMINNSYKYGFILRYPEDKSDITGYNSESWHFRYVGVDAAKYIYENNLTYEEYYAMNY